jgi:DNA-binding MarR family transcriptional regulator
MDSTTLTRTLALMRKQRWIRVKPGKDRRERVFRLTESGRRQIAAAQPHWDEAERRLGEMLGLAAFQGMRNMVSEATIAAAAA